MINDAPPPPFFLKPCHSPGSGNPTMSHLTKQEMWIPVSQGNDNLHNTSSLQKVKSFPRKRESTPFFPYQFVLLVLFFGFEISAEEKVFNLGNLIQGRLPEGSKAGPSTSSDNVPPNGAGAVVQGTLRVNVDSFDDFKICDKQGQCEKVCLSDGTGCPKCNQTCAELCIRRSTKLCRFRNGKQLASSPIFTSTDSSRFPEFIESMKSICWKPDGSKQDHTDRHAWHYTVSYGGWGSEGGHDHDRPFTGLQDCLNKLMTEGKCRGCKNCKQCISQLKVDSDPDHQRMQDNPFKCNKACNRAFELIVPTGYHFKW